MQRDDDEFVKGLFPAEFYNNGGEWEFDLIKKYIEEITVLASAKVYSGIQAGAQQDTAASGIIITMIENTQEPEKSVRIRVNPVDLGTELFNYIFDKLFGIFTFADSVVESPKDLFALRRTKAPMWEDTVACKIKQWID